jgi:hypothetical protein
MKELVKEIRLLLSELVIAIAIAVMPDSYEKKAMQKHFEEYSNQVL